MPIENGTVYWRQILRFGWLTQTKFYQKDQKRVWNKNSGKDISIKRRLSDGIDRNWHICTWNIIFWFYRKESNYNQKKGFSLTSKIIEIANKEKSFNNLSLNLQQGNLCRTEAILTSNNGTKGFKNSICNGNYEGVPRNMQ